MTQQHQVHGPRSRWREEVVDLVDASEDRKLRARATVAPYSRDGWLLLYSVQVAFTLIVVAVGVGLVALGNYNLDMYTYWSFTIVLATYLLLVVALPLEGKLLALTLLFALPLAIGSTFNVALLIVIAIQLNGGILLSAMPTPGHVAAVHTGDWAVHVLPLLSVLVLFMVGLQRYASAVLVAAQSAWSQAWWPARGLYAAYFVLAALVPMGVYSLIFDPAVKYPTGVPTYALWLVVILIDTVWMFVVYKALTANYHISVRISVPVSGTSPNMPASILVSSSIIPSVETHGVAVRVPWRDEAAAIESQASPSSSALLPPDPVLRLPESFNTQNVFSSSSPSIIIAASPQAYSHHHGPAKPHLTLAALAQPKTTLSPLAVGVRPGDLQM
jgi:hypothetical protein